MDRPWRDEANGWAAVLRKAKGAGLDTNLELMTTSAARLAELGRPCLPHLDFLIVNDFEIGALAGRETRGADGTTDLGALLGAVDGVCHRARCAGSRRHSPEGAIVGDRDGTRLTMGSVAMPPAAVAGAWTATPSPQGCCTACTRAGQSPNACGSRMPAPRRRCAPCRRGPPE